jgi:hypothetical protein
MCSSNIIEATVEGGKKGAVLGPVGVLAGSSLFATAEIGKEVGEELFPTPEAPKLPDQPDEKAETERARRRNLRRLVAARPGAGRRTTQRVSQGTGTGPTGLKTRTGQ